MTTEYFAETEDAIIFKARITMRRGTVNADNALYIKDGKIFRHIALTLLPNFDYVNRHCIEGLNAEFCLILFEEFI